MCCVLSVTRIVLSEGEGKPTKGQIEVGLAVLLFNPFCFFLSESLANKMMALQITYLCLLFSCMGPWGCFLVCDTSSTHLNVEERCLGFWDGIIENN